jgi:hypothetical protein
LAVTKNIKKLRTYHSLFCINKAFSSIAYHVRNLEEVGLMPIVKMRVLHGLTRELQSMISHDVVDKMHEIEDEDMFQHGKTRIAWENHLNPDRLALRRKPSR